MKNLSGLQYSNDNRFLSIDLDRFRNYDWFMDFIDLLEIEAARNEEKVSLDVFNKHVDKRLKQNV